MDDMPLNRDQHRARLWTRRGRAIGATFAALLLAGCGGYFSGEWPNLAEGFADAAERDAALEAAADFEVAPGAAPAEAAQAVAAPGEVAEPSPEPGPEPALELSPEEILRLATGLEAASLAVEAAQQDYLDARADFLDGPRGAHDGARGRWLTAQMKLTSLSRAADALGPILAELPLAKACAGDNGGDTCALARRADAANAGIVAYLAAERAFLTAQDPAKSS